MKWSFPNATTVILRDRDEKKYNASFRLVFVYDHKEIKTEDPVIVNKR